MPTTSRLAFVNAALRAAYAHNVLTAEDRHEFSGACETLDSLDEAEGWARLVVMDLSGRCRSFTPPVLVELTRLAAEAL